MNSSKKINISYSSLVGLKAELLRKQTEIEQAKAKNEVKDPTLFKPKSKIKKPKKLQVKEEKLDKTNKSTDIEDVNDLKKSRYMLEAKTKLYEQLKKTHGDKPHNYLVDFSKKQSSSSSSSSSSEEEDEIYKEEDYEDKNSDPEEDWVEYRDCFGRTRKCLRKDLPRMQEKDNVIKQEIKKESPEEPECPPQPPPFIPPQKEPEIEKLRKKWEEQSEKLLHKQDIHYQDILFDEARTHGVGYYAFSQNEEERIKQQENFLKLRKETEERQKEIQNIKELKAKMEKNRLKAARIRQRIRAGLPVESDDEETPETPKNEAGPPEVPQTPSNNDENDKEITEKNGDNSLAVVEDKIKAFGELLGKRPKLRELSQEEWIHKRRKDRIGEFAPVYENFQAGSLLKGSADREVVTTDNKEDPLKIKVSGPDPTDLWESQNFKTDDSDIIGPVPPPDFTPTEPVCPINSCIPSLPVGGAFLDSSESPIIPPIEVLKSIPPPNLNSNFCVGKLNHLATQCKEINEEVEKDEDEDSDESDIIGPLPPSDVPENDDLANIPLPSSPPSLTVQNNLNIDKIAEGLKYLRKKFDSCEDS